MKHKGIRSEQRITLHDENRDRFPQLLCISIIITLSKLHAAHPPLPTE
jgi:hypothetical protein